LREQNELREGILQKVFLVFPKEDNVPLLDFFSAGFLMNLISIIMIDLVLAGDNSIVIAMAVQSLPKKQRFNGILFGALAAVALRVIFTFFASRLLTISFVKLLGGILILWIAIRLLNKGEDEDKKREGAKSIWGAVWMIIVADLTMSLDNILAVAGASHGNFALLLFGLGLSIPLVIFASSLISKLMERFQIVIWIGALILGKVAGEMIATDPWLVDNFWAGFNLVEINHATKTANHAVVWTAELAGVGAVLLTSMLWRKTKSA
jgi:YjbE family integral membrane protein